MKPLLVVTASAITSLAMLSGALGESADPFGGLPSVNTTAPKGADFHDGDHGVDEERGAAKYSYPIAVPPGRSGMQPALALTYSSQAPLRGGIAVGWSLFDFPMVEVDRSHDSHALHYAVNGSRLVQVDDVKQLSTGTEEVYRANYDASFTRWEHIHSGAGTSTDPGVDYWVARKPDGSRMEFRHRVGGRQWRLTNQLDVYGNEITYDWCERDPSRPNACVPVKVWDSAPTKYLAYELQSIQYTGNIHTSIAPFARVSFGYSDSSRQEGSWIPPGAQLKWDDGPLLTNDRNADVMGIVMGSRQLDTIKTEVRDATAVSGWRTVQTTTLTYEMSDPTHGAKLRYLKYIDTAATAPCAYGMTCTPVTTNAPRITFSYGRYDRRWDYTGYAAVAPGAPMPLESGRSGQEAGATTGFMDINGDGLRDFVRIAAVRDKQDRKTNCEILWSKGLGDGRFGPESPQDAGILIPTMDWANSVTTDANGVVHPGRNEPSIGVDVGSGWVRERCTLTGQYALEYKDVTLGQLHCPNSYLKILGYHFGDYNNDGKIDIVTTPWNAMALDPPTSNLVGSIGSNLPGHGDGSCRSCDEDWSFCSGGSCIPRDVGTPAVPGWNDGDENGGHEGHGPGETTPSRFEPDTCEEWASLQPIHYTVHTPTREADYSVWGLLTYDSDSHSFGGTSVIHSPLPLPPPGQEQLIQAMTGPTPYTLQTMADIDSDGTEDILTTPRDPDSPSVEEWRTTRVDLGTAEWIRVGFGTPYGFEPGQFTKRSNGIVASTGTDGLFPWSQKPVSSDIDANATLTDINGDGLPDLVVRTSGENLSYYPNTGGRFAHNRIDLGFNVPVRRTHVDATWQADGPLPTHGSRQDKLQLIDVDEDGRPDLVELQADNAVRVRYNLGDGFGELRPLTPAVAWRALTRPTQMDLGQWQVVGEFTDVDGDGLADLQTWETLSQPPPGGAAFASPVQGSRLSWQTDNYGTSPPRLLNTVDNGRGAITTFEYQPNSKLENAGTLKPMFVVTKVSTTANLLPTMTTSYRYSSPQYGAHVAIDRRDLANLYDDETRAMQFQGFKEVEILGSAPQGQGHGSDVVNTYEYRADGRGYRVQQRSYVWDNGAVSRRLLTVGINSWMEEPLFDGRVYTVRNVVSDTRVCLTAVEEECLGDHSAGNFEFAGTSTFVRSLLVNSKRALYVPDTVYSYESTHTGQVTRPLFDLLYSANGQEFDYRVLPTETKVEGTGPQSSTVLVSRQKTIYDANHFPTTTRQWYGPGENDYVTSEQTFDTATGLVLTTKRPQQVKLGTSKVATYSYDADKVFAEVVINEIGYGAHTYYDPGTGAPIRKTGPNTVLVYAGSGCTSLGCPQSLQTEETAWRVDGFGRTVATMTTYQLGGTLTAAPMVTLATTSYDDVNNTVTSRSLIDPLEPTARWMTSRTKMDGLGRMTSQTTCRTAGASATDVACLEDASNAVVSYGYDAAGLMVSTTMPNPSTDASTVTYQFSHDSIGRETLMTRPDGSAMRVEYGPLTKKVTEAGTITNGGSTVAISDMSGNVTQLLECTAAPCDAMPGDVVAGPNWSVALYTYDDEDRLITATDAASQETVMEHDLLGRRTKITRNFGTRIWSYAYDDDSNMVSETSPMPIGADPSKYTSRNEYDVLDRLITHFPASREASDAQLAQSWSMPFAYRYDGVNAVGRLVGVDQPAPRPLGAGEIFYFSASYAYDGMGRVKQETRLMNPSGLEHQGITQSLSNTYNALGSVTRSVWDDGQTITTSYDDRGLTKVVEFSGAGNIGQNTIADYGTRNRAGLPLSRNTSQTFAKVARSWTYDSSGRVLTDVIQRPSVSGAPLTEAQRYYSYLPNGELERVTGNTRTEGVDTGTGFKALNEWFAFDSTHRVTTAREITTGYHLALSYDGAGNILTANIGGLSEATANRDVTYHYAGFDKQAVDQLTDTQTGNSIALITYTAIGEIATRNWPLGHEQRMDWDGDGQLREVHTPDGTTERYAYDQNGERIWAVKENAVDAGTRYWFGGSETSVPAQGMGRKRIIYIGDGGGTLARAERVDYGVPTLELSFADALQNAFLSIKSTTASNGAAIPNSVGVVTSWFHYGAFGEVIAKGGEAAHRRQFNGKEADAATGLRYYGARYYDPLLLRWASADPLHRFAPDASLDQPQRQNLYAFSLNNPVRLIDPDGMDPGAGALEWSREIVISGAALTAAALELGAVALVGVTVAAAYYYPSETMTTTSKAMVADDGPMNGSTTRNLIKTYFPERKVLTYGVQTQSNSKPVQRAPHENPKAQPKAGSASTSPPNEPPKGSKKTPGGEPGSRPGKAFTPAGKKKVWADNAAKNNGVPTCSKPGCNIPVVKPQQHQKGVTPPNDEGHVDHVDAKSNNGSGTPDNGQLLCRQHNLEKGCQ